MEGRAGVLACERYTRVPFPAYRYIPGSSPHPTADPRGHSRAQRRQRAAQCPPASEWAGCEDYLFGCDLYNHGYWWEAHEAWEGLWLTCGDLNQKRYLQGLIQAANAHLKLQMQRPNAVRRLGDDCHAHMAVALAQGERCMGLALPAWLADLDAYLEAALAQAPAVHDARRYPYLRLAPPRA